MTIADYAVFAVLILAYVTIAVAKAGDSTMRNDEPRQWAQQAQGWRRRLIAAHANHWEAFAPFAAGVLLAQQAQGRQDWIDALAMSFVVLRITYTLIYAQGLATVRSVVWFLGLACVFGLYAVAIVG